MIIKLKKKMYAIKMAAFVVLVLIFIPLVFKLAAAQLLPKNVNGYVFHIDGSTLAGGVTVKVNNTVNGNVIITSTSSSPPFFPFLGSYSSTVSGNVNHSINVTAWNATYYGFNVTNLTSTTTYSNVTLNIQRPSEANVTIFSPANNTLFNKSSHFNVTANISILGNDGTACNATIYFSSNALNISDGSNFTRVLGDISLGSHRTVNWSVIGLENGTSNITVAAQCSSDDVNLEGLNWRMLHNITSLNLDPRITNISIDDPIDLLAGDNLTVLCNATISDDNGIDDIRNLNATFFLASAGHGAPDDNNDHYTNTSCTATGSGETFVNYSCGFNVAYYANNGSWRCNVTVEDFSNVSVFRNSTASINQLLAIDVSPVIIDYGTLQAGNISEDFNVTITNLGNMDFNITVRGFAPNESLAYLNNSMICPRNNISNANHRFSIKRQDGFSFMKRMSNESQIVNLTFYQRTDDLLRTNDTNQTYWKFQVPNIPAGVCNGTVFFGTIPFI